MSFQIKVGGLLKVPPREYQRDPPFLAYVPHDWKGRLVQQLVVNEVAGTGHFYPTASGDVGRARLGPLVGVRALRSVHVMDFRRSGISGTETIPEKVQRLLGPAVRAQGLSFEDASDGAFYTDESAAFAVGVNQGFSVDHHYLLSGLVDPTLATTQTAVVTVDGGPVTITWGNQTYDLSQVSFGEQLSVVFTGAGQPTVPGYTAWLTPTLGAPDSVYQNQAALGHDLPLLRQFSRACVRHRLVCFFYRDTTGAGGAAGDLLNWFNSCMAQARGVADVRARVFTPSDSDDDVAALVASEVRQFYGFN